MASITKEVFYVLFLILGLVTYYISWNIDSSIATSTCKSAALKTSNKILLTISSLLVAISLLSLLGCDALSTQNKLIYSSITIILGLLLIILGSIIVANSGKDSSCSRASGEGAVWVIVFGIIIIGGSGYELYRKD